MAIVKFDSVYLENVTAQKLTPIVICDEARTASGKMRRDVVAIKRRWQLTASYLTPAQRDAILTLLSTKNYGAVAFWLDEFGAETNTILAYVTIDDVERVMFGDSTWHTDGANMTLTVEEQ